MPQLEGLEFEIIGKDSSDTPSQIDKVTDSLKKLENISNKLNLDKLKGSFKGTFTKIETPFNGLTKGVGDFARTFSKASGITAIFEKLKQYALSFGNALKHPINSLAKLSEAVTKFSFKKIGGALLSPIKGIQKLTSSLKGLLKAMGRIALYRAIRSFLKALSADMQEGINNMYQYSQVMDGKFASSMDRLATSGKYLSNSLGAMAAPIINALAPAIDYVIDKIVALLNLINQLFAALGGATTFTRAKKNQQSFADSLSNTGSSAGKAAKEIKDATGSIDELNIISENDSSGSGGGGGIDVGSMFEDVAIDSNISNFMDRIKKAIEEQDWYGLGRLLGNKFNEIFAEENYLKWHEWGVKVGQGINAVILTALGFLRTADFGLLGGSLANFINGAIETIQWGNLGAVMVRGLTSIIDFGIGFIKELNFEQLGTAIREYIVGAYREVVAWSREQDWAEISRIISNKISDFFRGLAHIDLGAAIAGMFILGFQNAARIAVAAVDIIVRPIARALGLEDKWDEIHQSLFDGIDKMGDLIKDEWTRNVEKARTPITETTLLLSKDIVNALDRPDGVELSEHSRLSSEKFTKSFDDVIVAQTPSLVSSVGLLGTDLFTTFNSPDGMSLENHSRKTATDSTNGYMAVVRAKAPNMKDLIQKLSSKIASLFDRPDGQTLEGHFRTTSTDSTNAYETVVKNRTPIITTMIKNLSSKIANLFDKPDGTSLGRHFNITATDAMKGANSGITSNRPTLYANSRTTGSQTLKLFKDNAKESSFYDHGRNIIQGVLNGLESMTSALWAKVSSLASSIGNAFSSVLQIHSPSRLFKSFGEYTIEGYINGVKNMEDKSYGVMNEWANGIAQTELPDFAQAMNIDSSAINHAINGSVNSEVYVKNASTMEEAFTKFYIEYMREDMKSLVETSKVTSQKDTNVNVQIGSKTVSDAVKEQQSANGFSFT